MLLIETLVLLTALGMELYSERAHRHDHDLSSYETCDYWYVGDRNTMANDSGEADS